MAGKFPPRGDDGLTDDERAWLTSRTNQPQPKGDTEMGMSKIKVLGPGRVKAIHQLNSDGTPYAEDVTIESSVPGRLSYLESQDGKVGVFSFGFSPSEVGDGLVFPEDD